MNIILIKERIMYWSLRNRYWRQKTRFTILKTAVKLKGHLHSCIYGNAAILGVSEAMYVPYFEGGVVKPPGICGNHSINGG